MATPQVPSTLVAGALAPSCAPANNVSAQPRLAHWRRPALEPVTCLSYGGGMLAGAGGRVTCVWDTETNQLIRRFVTAEPVTAVWMAHDGTSLAVAAATEVAVYTGATGARRFAYRHAADVTSVHIDTAGRLMASADAAGLIEVRDATTGSRIQQLACAPGHPLVFVFRNRFVLVGTATCSLLMDATTGELLRKFPYDPREPVPNEGLLLGTTLVAYTGSVVRWFDCTRLRGAHCMRDLGSPVRSIDIDDEAGLALAATQDGKLHLFDLSSGEPVARHESFTIPLQFARFGPHRSSIFVAGGEALVMHLVEGRHVSSYIDETPPLVAMTPTRAGDALLCSDRDGGVARVSLHDATPPRLCRAHSGSVSAVACSENVAISGAYDGTVRVMDPQLRVLATVDLQQGPVQALALDAHGQAWAGTWGGRIHRIDLGNGQVTAQIDAFASSLRTLALDANGDRLCAGSNDGDLSAYDLRAGPTRLFGLRLPGAVYRAVFDADGTIWATAHDGVRRYEVGGSNAHVTFAGDTIRWFDLHAGRLAALSLGGALCLFDIASGAVLHRTVIPSRVNHRSVFFLSADRIVTASADGVVRVFDGRLQQVAELELPQNGFVWQTTPRAPHPGWLHTDRPDLVDVGERNDAGKHALAENDPARARHLAVFGSAPHVMRIVLGEAAGVPRSALAVSSALATRFLGWAPATR